jgi:hypothetical protein
MTDRYNYTTNVGEMGKRTPFDRLRVSGKVLLVVNSGSARGELVEP